MNETRVINLNDSKFIESLENEFKDIIITDDISGAVNFYSNLEKIHQKYESQIADKNIKFKYEQMIDLAKWVAVTSINKDEEVIRIINSYISWLLRNEEVDLWSKIEQKLRSILVLEERDILKNGIKESLLKNDAIITQKGLYLSGKEFRGSVANWLKYYNSIFFDEYVSNIKLQEFINSDNNLRNIDKKEKNLVAKLFYFYTKIKQSSFSYEGIEDYIFVDDGKNIGWIKSGVFTPLKSIDQRRQVINYGRDILKKALGKDYDYFFGRSISSEAKDEKISDINKIEAAGRDFISSSDKLLMNYRIMGFDWQETVKLSDKMDSYYSSGVKFKNEFHEGINSRDKIKITAGLLTLARRGQLDEIFERDTKIKDIFKEHLVKKFSTKLAQHFEQNLRAPVYLSYFLQHLLKDILKLDDNESAVLAIKLVNELKQAGDKQYLPIAYGDLKEGVFKWKGIVDKDDRLELAD